MNFTLPTYTPPDFTSPLLATAPIVTLDKVKKDGVAPTNYHATTIFPEYFKLDIDKWELVAQSRMDSVVVYTTDGRLDVREFRRLKKGDCVVVGRSVNGEEGIYVHTQGFHFPEEERGKFSFRSSRSRETAFSIDYDQLYGLLEHDRREGRIVWVVGPAVVFDHDAREAFAKLIRQGYVHALLAGNAMATHDIEATFFGTALGQQLYHQATIASGHYHHLDAINTIKAVGSIEQAVENGVLQEGVMHSLVTNHVPYVLAGSIRDDGPLPGVIGDVYEAQDRMRAHTRQATTVIGLATQLHTIASGNMTPSYSFDKQGNVRPVYFYLVDMSEFAVNKLADRGSLIARSILTNVQDFIVTLQRGLKKRASTSPE
ncbi:hypothetical protein [Desulfogranum marinum]|uniref:ornithine cyclodeaminase family domain n=1 Tax=Desulfogranum marinum TaxID=453220 RepID=UPI0029C80645|nr:hypothetical protein [Desulfogranum marinum]